MQILEKCQALLPWIPDFRRAGIKDVSAARIVCFPPAGAGAGFFHGWESFFPDYQLIPVQLPGREERFGESPLSDAGEIAECIASALCEEPWQKLALVGYSFGALLAFETALLLERRGRCVSHVVACARGAPQSVAQPPYAPLSDVAFLARFRALGGIPPEVDAEPQFLDLLLPVLRADAHANDSYTRPAECRINAPITTISGSDDPVTCHNSDADWGARTRGRYHSIRVNGGHFFVRENTVETLRLIKQTLGSLTPQPGVPA